ncbi:MAG: restriction endonuclease subunit S [Candidatus Saelkia tenebricola]|nr:restriction endonuclease subunit S [Candidatus Saelkia tenebricola]
MPEWRKYRLEDILSIVKKSVNPCSIDECNYIGLEHIAGKSFLLNDIGSSQDVESNKYSFKPNDILYGKLRPYFQKVYKPSFKGICSTDIFVIRTKDEKVVSQDFLYQIVREKKFTEWAMEGHTGTRMPRADWQALRKKMVLIPDDLNEQHRIASILSALDDKIELNLEMNKTLEEMAMAIYKEWFVDFGPFCDGEFVDSELGPIPKGWKVNQLKDVAFITMGQSPSSKYYNQNSQGFSFHQGIKDYGWRFPTNITYSTEGKRFAEKGDILFSVRAPVGRINIAGTKLILGRGLAGIRHRDYKNTFLFYSLKTVFTKDDIIGNGTVYKSVNKNDVEGLKILLPDTETLNGFIDITEPLDLLIEANTKEVKTLQDIRDYLLPKLISGKIRVKAAEKKLKEVL